MQIKTPKKSTKKQVLVPLLVFALLLGGWITYAYTQKTWPFSVKTQSSSSEDGESVNYDPPTQQEVENSQNGKKNSGPDKKTNDTDTSSQKKPASVGISYADIYNNNLEIRAFTNGVIEGTGKCTATVTMGNTKVTKSNDAFIDASTTQCKPIYIPASDLSSGTWKVSVTFSSPDHEGTSEVVEVKVP